MTTTYIRSSKFQEQKIQGWSSGISKGATLGFGEFKRGRKPPLFVRELGSGSPRQNARRPSRVARAAGDVRVLLMRARVHHLRVQGSYPWQVRSVANQRA